MNLTILLPYRIFAHETAVSHIVAETSAGSLGLLPNRLDCVAALIPGILTYEAPSAGMTYVAVAAGVLVKTGADVLLSVRHAFGGVDLHALQALVKRQLVTTATRDREVRAAVTRMESALVGRIAEFERGR